MRKRQVPVVVGVAAVVAMLAACSVPAPESLLDAYEARAEQIHAELLQHLPAVAGQSVSVSSRAWIDETEWLVPRERQVAHWTTESTVELDDDTAPAAAAAIGAHLVAERWSAESIADPGGFRSDVYRLAEADAEWIVEVSWEDRSRLVVIVQSPVTVRGVE